MESLTKENFWNSVYEKYTPQVQQFCDWIDEYKKRMDWNMLFNSDSDYQNAQGKNAPAPKYHDLPIAMQAGIFLQYVLETKREYGFQITFNPARFKDMSAFALIIEGIFQAQHEYDLKSKESQEIKAAD